MRRFQNTAVLLVTGYAVKQTKPSEFNVLALLTDCGFDCAPIVAANDQETQYRNCVEPQAMERCYGLYAEQKPIRWNAIG